MLPATRQWWESCLYPQLKQVLWGCLAPWLVKASNRLDGGNSETSPLHLLSDYNVYALLSGTTLCWSFRLLPTIAISSGMISFMKCVTHKLYSPFVTTSGLRVTELSSSSEVLPYIPDLVTEPKDQLQQIVRPHALLKLKWLTSIFTLISIHGLLF